MEGYVSKEEHQQLKVKYELLEAERDQLRRLVFGAKSERFVSSEIPAEQLGLFGQSDQTSKPVVKTKEVAAHQRKFSQPKKKPARLVLPQHLERRETVIEPEGLEADMVKIGEARSEQLVYEPANMYVKVTVRPRYIHKSTAQEAVEQEADEKTEVLIADMPCRFIPKCMAHESLLAAIIVDKYVDHLPLYRTIDRIYRLSELRLPKSTVSGWVGQSAGRLTILYEKLVDTIIQSPYLQVDETRMEVLPNSPPSTQKNKRKSRNQRKSKAKKSKTQRGWLWVYHSPLSGLTFFDYDESRGANNPARHLKNYTGQVQSDGYEVYDLIAKAYPTIEHFACLVHARRKFDHALGNDAQRATHVLQLIQQIYAIETKAQEEQLEEKQIYELRQTQSRPILETLFDWLEEQSYQVLPKSPIGKAMAYMIQRKQQLLHFLSNGALLPDTNLVENAIRPVAVGRKNYLFAGSHDAAQWAAIFYSFFACCKVHKVNPYEWLIDVMQRLPEQSIQNIDALLPHLWEKGRM